jgi:hypothetical protein
MTTEKKEKIVRELTKEKKDDVPDDKSLAAEAVEIILPQEFIKAEKNLETLGFFTPSSNWTREVKKKVISFTRTEGNKRVKASVTILPSTEYGLPDTSDLDKYRAFQKILSDELLRNGKVPKHLTFSSAKLIKEIGISRENKSGKSYAGKFHKEIKDWLMRMLLTGVQSEGAVWLAGRKVWVTDTVHVFERVITCGQKLDDGTIADLNHVWLSDWQLENVNEFWLLSIDYDLYKQLRKPIAKSLLSLLQIGFYASGGIYTKRYDELCQFLGITNHKRFSYIKRQLEPSFKELQEKSFLANWDYEENKIYKTYNIIWFAGERFFEAQELLQEREERLTKPVQRKPKRITKEKPKQKPDFPQQPKATVETLPEVLSEPEPPELEEAKSDFEPLTPEEVNEEVDEDVSLVKKLVELNVSKIVAADLVKHFDLELIREWIEAIDYSDAKDKAAYIVKAIKENWFVPEKYLIAKEKAERGKELEKLRLAEEERKKEEKKKQQEEAYKLDKIYNSLSPAQKEEVDLEIQEKLPFFAKDRIREGATDSPLVIASLKLTKEQVIKEWIEAGKIEPLGE